MFAIIESGGKQYRVMEGLQLRVEKLPQEAGSVIDISQVLMVGEGDKVKVGAPYVDSASVQCEVVGHGRGKKVMVFKHKKRKDYRKKQGHRQDFTTIKVTAISA